MTEEFLPTLGNLIKKTDDILKDVPLVCYPDYAKSFKGTLIEQVIFMGENFEEIASLYCEEAGWTRPS